MCLNAFTQPNFRCCFPVLLVSLLAKCDRPFARDVFILGIGQTYSTYTFIVRFLLCFSIKLFGPGVCLGIAITWGNGEGVGKVRLRCVLRNLRRDGWECIFLMANFDISDLLPDN